ncbi:hypothetical protein Ciccas_002853 [Cichlidogyrus casuarinus]|uniref:TBC domain-containing protein kinase-like protein n=1 Tax=Cichlidogyrus casuarinus TaxID=1844966 RepID=A0ABD2QGN3_9PLAT
MDMRKVRHKYLCSYIYALRCKNERIYYVAECYPLSFQHISVQISSDFGKQWLASKYFECLIALEFLLHRHNIVHGCLKPSDLMLSPCGSIKMAGFGIFLSTNWGRDVKFPLGPIAYHSPEMLLNYYQYSKNLRSFLPNTCPVDSRTDLWSLSLIFLGAIHGKQQTNPMLGLTAISDCIKYLFTNFTEFIDNQNFVSPFEALLKNNLALKPANRLTLSETNERIVQEFNFHKDENLEESSSYNPLLDKQEMSVPVPSLEVLNDLGNRKLLPEIVKALDFVKNCNNLDELFHYWQLCGNQLSDVWYHRISQSASKDDDLVHRSQQMPILSIPHISYIVKDEENGKAISSELVWSSDQVRGDFKYDCSLFPLPAKRLVQQLARIPIKNLYPTILNTDQDFDELAHFSEDFYTGTDPFERFESKIYQVGLHAPYSEKTNSSTNCRSIDLEPIAVKETEVSYQILRIRLFLVLLRGLPLTEVRLRLEARKDIPPFVRAKVWAALLGVHRDNCIRERYLERLLLAGMSFKSEVGSYQSYFNLDPALLAGLNNFDSSTIKKPTTPEVELHFMTTKSVLDEKSINQIAVDLPRCHAYDPLLSSDYGQMKLRRVLTSALVDGTNPNSYTQGMDSLAAVFTRISYADEALASAMLNALIEQRLAGMFTVGGFTLGLTAYFVVIRRLLAFHMPNLATHFHRLNVPITGLTTGWIYTLFAHSIPLDLAEQLWDSMLPAPSSILIFIYLAVFKLLQSQTRIERMGLEQICTLLSNFPQVNLDRLRADAIKFAENTPGSLVKHPGLPKCPVKIPINSEARRYAQNYIFPNWPVQFDELEFNEAYQELQLLHRQKTSHEISQVSEGLIASGHNRSASAVSQIIDPESGSQNEGFAALISCKDVILHHSRPDCLVIDLRSSEDFHNGSLIGSINRPNSEVSLTEDPQPPENERFLRELKSDPAWIRTTQARHTIEPKDESNSPGLVIVLVESDSDSDSTMARNVASCLVQSGIDRVTVASGGAAVLDHSGPRIQFLKPNEESTALTSDHLSDSDPPSQEMAHFGYRFDENGILRTLISVNTASNASPGAVNTDMAASNSQTQSAGTHLQKGTISYHVNSLKRQEMLRARGLNPGSQIELVKRAHDLGFAIAIINANEHVPTEAEMDAMESGNVSGSSSKMSGSFVTSPINKNRVKRTTYVDLLRAEAVEEESTHEHPLHNSQSPKRVSSASCEKGTLPRASKRNLTQSCLSEDEVTIFLLTSNLSDEY